MPTWTLSAILTIVVLATTAASSNPPPPPCRPLDLPDVVLLNATHLLLRDFDNATIPMTSTRLGGVCFDRTTALKAAILDVCDKYHLFEDEYRVLGNGSVDRNGTVMEPGTYMFDDGELWTCMVLLGPETGQIGEENPHGISRESFVKVGKVGAWVSIVALSAPLVVFCMVPALRNLPGYHLAALSVAFLFGYSFSLIGQIPKVLGAECVASGILQQYFFLAAFFCMNVMAVDVFRTLRLATRQLAVNGGRSRRQFAFYMLYAWGAPLLITAPCALLDVVAGVPDWLRPKYGSNDVCWMGNDSLKAVFFQAPSFVLFAANSALFVASAVTVHRHSFKGGEHQQQGRVTFVLYLRLGVMMGLTWLLGLVAALAKTQWLWFTFDLFNSLQGLFICLLFFCSERVRNRIRDRWAVSSSSTNVAADKPSSNGTTASDAPRYSMSVFAARR